MNQEILQKLFTEQIRDLYDAEKQLVKALPKLAKAAGSEELADALRAHLEETQNQVSRLEEVFQIAGVPAKGKPCKAMKGLVEEGSEAIQENEKGALRDLAIIAAGQRVEHYEISAYGTVCALAEHLGLDEALRLLEETKEEEAAADGKLTEVAKMLYESIGQDEEGADEEAEAVGASASRGVRNSSSHSARSRP